MPVSRFQGIVPVEMFDSGQTLIVNTYGPNYSPLNFDPQSDNPMLSNDANNPSVGTIANFSSVVMAALGGPSEMLINPVAQPLGGHSQSYIDGIVSFIGLGPGGLPAFYYKSQPRGPGNWNPSPFSWYGIGNITPAPSRFLPFGNAGGQCPMMNRGKPVIGGFINNSTEGDGHIIHIASLTDFPGINTNVFDTLLGGIPFSYELNKLSCREATPGAVYDNYIYQPAVSIIEGGPFPNSILSYNSRDISTLNIQPIMMDNPTLDAIFQGMSAPQAKAYNNGFTFPLVTHGTGPTRQFCEFCVFSKDFTQYYILQLIPMDAEASSQLLANSSGPQLKIDTDGVIWYNTGDGINQAKVLSSFSSGYNFPVYYFGNLQPITLPCFVDSMALGLYA